MNLSVERTVAEGKRLRSHAFFELTPRNWLIYATILLATVPAFVMESSIEGDMTDFKIEIGGPVSSFGMICAVCFVVYDLFCAARRKKSLAKAIADNDKVFLDFSEHGVHYGIRDIWSKSCSWALVSRIAFAGQSIHFYIPGTQLLVTTEIFDADQLVEMKHYLAAVRETVSPESFFGWRRQRRRGREVFGKLKE